jgi:peptidoglycan hydrolase CwlO-like protein
MEILVAVIAASSAIMVALVQRSRKENSVDHRAVMDIVSTVGQQVTQVEQKVDRLDAKVERIDAKVERYAKQVDESAERDNR